MDLSECRSEIDRLDAQIKELVLKRLDVSYQVAQAKHDAGSSQVLRPEREAQIISQLGADVPAEKRAAYVAVVRTVMETSRMYQYDLLYSWDESLFSAIEGAQLAAGPSESVTVAFTCANAPRGFSSVAEIAGDRGFNLVAAKLVEATDDTASFEVTIEGDAAQEPLRKLLFQLSKETQGFRIVGTR